MKEKDLISDLNMHENWSYVDDKLTYLDSDNNPVYFYTNIEGGGLFSFNKIELVYGTDTINLSFFAKRRLNSLLQSKRVECLQKEYRNLLMRHISAVRTANVVGDVGNSINTTPIIRETETSETLKEEKLTIDKHQAQINLEREKIRKILKSMSKVNSSRNQE